MTKETFLNGVQNWNNHLYLLWPALEATTGEVVEMGMGHGSTQQLHDYCLDRGRQLFSYESDPEWADKFMHLVDGGAHSLKVLRDWDEVHAAHPSPDVILIDHAPGERRKFDIALFANSAKIIVVHDTEPAADHGYKMRAELEKFKYRNDFVSAGAWSTSVSNFINVSKLEPC